MYLLRIFVRHATGLSHVVTAAAVVLSPDYIRVIRFGNNSMRIKQHYEN